MVTDTQGLLIGLNVHAANEYDSRSIFRVLENLRGCFDRLEKIYADGGYRSGLIDKVKNMLNCNMEITLRIDNATDNLYQNGGLLSDHLLGLITSVGYPSIVKKRLFARKI